MKILEVKGNYYQMGFKIGEYFKDYYQSISNKYIDACNNSDVQAVLEVLKEKLNNNFSAAKEEIDGRADGAKIDKDVMLLMASPELFKKGSGCTSVAYKNNGNVYLSHNEDESDFTIENQILIKYQYEDHYVYGYSNALKIVGSAFGFNSYGLVFVSNWLPFDHIEEKEISRYIYERQIYDCKTIAEAKEKILKMKIATPFSMTILDLNTKELVNFEKDFDQTYITNIENTFVHSNHFLNKNFEASESSKYRFSYPDKVLKECTNIDLATLQNVLCHHSDDYDHSVFKKHNYSDKPITVANISVDSIERVVTIKDYLQDCLLNFNL